jgi:hypothetical protein
MITEKSKAHNEGILAEKCRIALEKSFGMPVPTPNCLSKKHQLNYSEDEGVLCSKTNY